MENAAGQSGKPSSWGLHSLDPFFAGTSATPFVLDFSSPVSSVSFEFGDYGGDSDTEVAKAFSGPGGTGTMLTTASDLYGVASFTTVHSLTVAGSGINSIVFIGGSAGFPNSLFYDNFKVVVEAVPEPGVAVSALAACSAIAGAAFARRARRRKA